MSILGLSTEWGDRIFQSIVVRGKNENLCCDGIDLNILSVRAGLSWIIYVMLAFIVSMSSSGGFNLSIFRRL